MPLLPMSEIDSFVPGRLMEFHEQAKDDHAVEILLKVQQIFAKDQESIDGARVDVFLKLMEPVRLLMNEAPMHLPDWRACLLGRRWSSNQDLAEMFLGWSSFAGVQKEKFVGIHNVKKVSHRRVYWLGAAIMARLLCGGELENLRMDQESPSIRLLKNRSYHLKQTEKAALQAIVEGLFGVNACLKNGRF
jgi:hypothetical protein